MKTKLLIAAFVILQSSLFVSLQAQSRFDATVFAGANFCQIDGDQAGSYSHVGLRAGVGTSFALSSDVSSPWRMTVELAFTNKGSYNKTYNTTLSASYIEIPLLLTYSGMENRLRIGAGVAPAVKVGESFTNGYAGDNIFTTVDWLPLTFSVRYRFFEHLGIEARFQYSALSVTNDNSNGTYFLVRSNKGCFHNLASLGLTYTF